MGIKKELVQEETSLDSSWIMGNVSLIIFISEKKPETLLNAGFFGTVDHDFDH